MGLTFAHYSGAAINSSIRQPGNSSYHEIVRPPLSIDSVYTKVAISIMVPAWDVVPTFQFVKPYMDEFENRIDVQYLGDQRKRQRQRRFACGNQHSPLDTQPTTSYSSTDINFSYCFNHLPHRPSFKPSILFHSSDSSPRGVLAH